MKRFSLIVATCACVAAFVFGLSASSIAASEYNWANVIADYQEVGYEDFAYNNGNLNSVGAPRWGGTTGGRTYVSNQEISMAAVNVGAASTDCTWNIDDLTAASGKIVVGMRFWEGIGNKVNDYKSVCGLEALDQNGVVLGAINGYKSTDTNAWSLWGQVGPSDGVGPNPGPAATQTSRWQIFNNWTDSYMVIDTAAKTVQFLWYNSGVLHDYGSLSYGAYSSSSTLGSIRIMVHGPNWATSRPTMYADNLTYGEIVAVPEPSGLLALATFGVGAFGLIRRRRA